MILPSSTAPLFLGTLVLTFVVFQVTDASSSTPQVMKLRAEASRLDAVYTDVAPGKISLRILSSASGTLVSADSLFVQALSSRSVAPVSNSRHSASDSMVVQEGPSLAKIEAIKTKRPPAKTDSDVLVKGISRSRAVTIARRKALRSYGSLKRFNVVPCEQVRFWRVIYDGGGPEYVIDKLSGRIIRTQVLPQGSKSASAGRLQTGRDRAIQLATADAEETYAPHGEAVNQYAVFACELTNSWRVVFDHKMHTGERLRDFPNASFPKYVIEKGTGKIIHKQLN